MWGQGRPSLDLTLAKSISLAIQNNRGLMNSRLDRALQKFALKVAEDEFRPNATIKPSVRFDSTEGRDDDAEVISELTLRVPTGGQFAVSWNDKTLSRIGFTQPLLKGGWVAVNTASLKTARLREEVNILALRAAVSSTVDSVIAIYRNLIQAGRRLNIYTRSLQRAQDLLATNQALIQAGRMAQRDIIQSEADVANRELSLIEARDGLHAARLALTTGPNGEGSTAKHRGMCRRETRRCVELEWHAPRIRHQTGFDGNQAQTIGGEAVAGARGFRHRAGACESHSQGLRRSAGEANHADPVFHPSSGGRLWIRNGCPIVHLLGSCANSGRTCPNLLRSTPILVVGVSDSLDPGEAPTSRDYFDDPRAVLV